jgi:hypothetical protein
MYSTSLLCSSNVLTQATDLASWQIHRWYGDHQINLQLISRGTCLRCMGTQGMEASRATVCSLAMTPINAENTAWKRYSSKHSLDLFLDCTARKQMREMIMA